MTRLITKQMRDSFKVSSRDRMLWWMRSSSGRNLSDGFTTANHFNQTKKQRILILKGAIK